MLTFSAYLLWLCILLIIFLFVFFHNAEHSPAGQAEDKVVYDTNTFLGNLPGFIPKVNGNLSAGLGSVGRVSGWGKCR